MAEQSAFDLVIVGGGPGVYPAAIRAAQYGLRVALVEKERVGGVCLNWGCIPTKAMLRSAEVLETLEHSSDFGVDVDNVRLNYPKVLQRKDAIVKGLTDGVGQLLKANGVSVYKGHARFTSPNTVEVVGTGKSPLGEGGPLYNAPADSKGQPTADDHDVFRHLLQQEGAIGVDDTWQLVTGDRQLRWCRAGGDDDVLACQCGGWLALAVGRRVVQRAAFAQRRLASADDLDGVRAGEAGVALVHADGVGLEQLADAVGEAFDDSVFALEDFGVIEPNVIDVDAKVAAVLEGLEDFGAAEHGLGGDASPVQAHAADTLLFDERDAKSVLGGADRRGVAARPAADDDQIKGALRSEEHT